MLSILLIVIYQPAPGERPQKETEWIDVEPPARTLDSKTRAKAIMAEVERALFKRWGREIQAGLVEGVVAVEGATVGSLWGDELKAQAVAAEAQKNLDRIAALEREVARLKGQPLTYVEGVTCTPELLAASQKRGTRRVKEK